MTVETAFIALGANLQDPLTQVTAALDELAALPQTRLTRRSSLYRSAPAGDGYRGQPDFINAAAQIETALAPRALLDALLAIERKHGRIREFRNAPRTLDLDLLLYGGLRHHEPGLTLPHPRLHERAFVLLPLAEIAPGANVPGCGRVAELLNVIDTAGVTKLDPAAVAR
ncbi:MAG TPA: 2-amino-4-hydroxy-6-hydroxymethyldihydropteridine diphosphokinase [Burkholderiales bacterium]|nr:2-amino-4-hydroxy-6-hydroxymethyldihydropteridine diphosphokinase [Burkholderiales bacterium]